MRARVPQSQWYIQIKAYINVYIPVPKKSVSLKSLIRFRKKLLLFIASVNYTIDNNDHLTKVQKKTCLQQLAYSPHRETTC